MLCGNCVWQQQFLLVAVSCLETKYYSCCIVVTFSLWLYSTRTFGFQERMEKITQEGAS
jgi:hypothetical protein